MSDRRRGRVRIEPCQKRVRAYLGGHPVVDTTGATLVWEVPYYPAFYVPVDDVAAELEPSGRVERSPSRGDATYYDVRLEGAEARDGAWRHLDSPIEELQGLVRFVWDAMDRWLEEDEPVIVHPRDPGTRVEVLDSSRHVVVEIDGHVVADSVRPKLLFETGLPTRYYLPITDVRQDLFVASSTRTACPYKGVASYWSIALDGQLHEDSVWTYPSPLPESQRIAGLVCFYNERVDLVVDGVRLDRPRTKFS